MKLTQLQTKWLEALRSGKYKQGRHCLRNSEEKFCCLGVAADCYDNTKWIKIENNSMFRYLKRTSVLTSEMNSLFYIEEIISKLIAMNDDGESFLDIAAYLEDYWAKLPESTE